MKAGPKAWSQLPDPFPEWRPVTAEEWPAEKGETLIRN